MLGHHTRDTDKLKGQYHENPQILNALGRNVYIYQITPRVDYIYEGLVELTWLHYITIKRGLPRKIIQNNRYSETKLME